MSEPTPRIADFYPMGARVRVTAGHWAGWLGSTTAYTQLGTDTPGMYAVRLANNVLIEVPAGAVILVEEEEITALDLLRGAPAVIRERGWHQGWYLDRAQSFTVPVDKCRVCPLGAMHVVSGSDDPSGGAWSDAVTDAADLVIVYLRSQGVDADYLSDWNDVPGRTVDEVLAALDGAAQLLAPATAEATS